MDPQPGVYQHYKGKKYRVHFVAKHSETLEDFVVYEALYESDIGKYWIRPLKMFVEEIELNGERIKRFEYTKD